MPIAGFALPSQYATLAFGCALRYTRGAFGQAPACIAMGTTSSEVPPVARTAAVCHQAPGSGDW